MCRAEPRAVPGRAVTAGRPVRGPVTRPGSTRLRPGRLFGPRPDGRLSGAGRRDDSGVEGRGRGWRPCGRRRGGRRGSRRRRAARTTASARAVPRRCSPRRRARHEAKKPAAAAPLVTACTTPTRWSRCSSAGPLGPAGPGRRPDGQQPERDQPPGGRPGRLAADQVERTAEVKKPSVTSVSGGCTRVPEPGAAQQVAAGRVRDQLADQRPDQRDDGVEGAGALELLGPGDGGRRCGRHGSVLPRAAASGQRSHVDEVAAARWTGIRRHEIS